MPLFRVTVKTAKNSNGIRIEKGMSVEVVASSTSSNPLTTNGGKLVADAFMHIYGIGQESWYFVDCLFGCTTDWMMICFLKMYAYFTYSGDIRSFHGQCSVLYLGRYTKISIKVYWNLGFFSEKVRDMSRYLWLFSEIS